MKKIIIAIDNDFIREAYNEVFKKSGFEVFETKSGKHVLDLAKKEKPNLILIDILLSEIGGVETLRQLKKDNSVSKIPVIVFAQLERREDRMKAADLGAKDFITAASVSPSEVIRRVSIVLGEQKTYRITPETTEELKALRKDLDNSSSLKCSKCGADLKLYLIRDLSEGSKVFIVSFICPKCE